MGMWWISLAGSTATFIAGTVYLKRFADSSSAYELLIAFALLTVGNLMFVQVLRSGLGTGLVASSMSQIIVMALLGAVFFGERLGTYQIAGVALAALSIFLMVQPSSQSSIA